MFDKFLSLIAPHQCVGCEREGALVCTDCRVGLTPAVRRCYRCHKARPDWSTCPTCRRKSKLYSVSAAAKYDGAAELLVRRLKFGGAVAGASEIAEMLAPLVNDKQNLTISHLPTATSRVRGRGFDQARSIARELSDTSSLPYVNFLARIGQARQVGASRADRRAQAEKSYRICNRSLLAGANVVLVDDVITTGASLEAAAAVLRANGAKRVYGLVFCQA